MKPIVAFAALRFSEKVSALAWASPVWNPSELAEPIDVAAHFVPDAWLETPRPIATRDPTPVPAQTLDPAVPDADRYFPAFGVSLGYRGLGSIELSYTPILLGSRTSENPNLALTYETTIHVFGAAINLQLERVFGKRSPAFAARLLSRSPELPAEEAAPTAR